MAELRQAEASVEKEVVQWYHRVTELWSDMLEGKDEAVREWLLEAEKLVEMFRHTRPLFLTSRVGLNEFLSAWLADSFFSIKASAACFPALGEGQLRRVKRAWLFVCSSSFVSLLVI